MVAKAEKKTEGAGDRDSIWDAQVDRSVLMYSETLTEALGAGGGDRRATISIPDTCEGEEFRRAERMCEPCVACQQRRQTFVTVLTTRPVEPRTNVEVIASGHYPLPDDVKLEAPTTKNTKGLAGLK